MSIPAHLMKLLDIFLPCGNSDAIVSELLPVDLSEVKPVLLHGDLTAENILGIAMNDESSDAILSSSGKEPQASELSTFLTSIGCEKYISLLVEQEELTLESLMLVDETHLKDLGIPMGPRLAILSKKRSILTRHIKAPSGSRFDTDEEWETSSSSSNSSSEDESESHCTSTIREAAAMEAKRKEQFLGTHEWVSTSVIDFADAKSGDPLYDLVAVFFAALVSELTLNDGTV
ncbi:hypothetical protein PsorP6_003341 [Peronosclerospora sorghi]|uniref:Uncharacterized protein n=1 Tax=Peronosclerospora sorghi TaxID=230839 RepID=A0ACC0VS96_9STRA|nr:hypothetical protein PsorP6_003341 [Peronosclerospora sorghi]